MSFADAPALPDWLAPAMPFRRRLFGGRHGRVHLVDEGEGRPVLLLHGNPTWSFLWRKVVPLLRGHRVVAPDLLGFGLSSKPLRTRAHTLDAHVDAVVELVEALDLRDLTVVGQDWGGPIGACAARRLDDRVHGLVFANTAVLAPRRPFHPKDFHRFAHMPVASDLAFRGLNFPIPWMHRVQGNPFSIGPFEKRAYGWPFRRPWRRAGPLALARMVPDTEDHPSTAALDAIDPWVRAFRGPKALVWGLWDPLLGRALGRLQDALPDAQVTETTAGHFLQEEVPDELADAISGVSRRPSPA